MKLASVERQEPVEDLLGGGLEQWRDPEVREPPPARSEQPQHRRRLTPDALPVRVDDEHLVHLAGEERTDELARKNSPSCGVGRSLSSATYVLSNSNPW